MTKTPDEKGVGTEHCSDSQTKQPKALESVDFDEFARLARENPEGYFRQRLSHVSEVLAHLSQTQRVELSVLQSMIDQMRLLSGTPERAQAQLFSMLEENLVALQRACDELHRLLSDVRPTKD